MNKKIATTNEIPRIGVTVTLLVDYDIHLTRGMKVHVERVLLPIGAVAVLHPVWLFLVWFMRDEVELEGI